jgi:sialic acid synthase SpsE
MRAGDVITAACVRSIRPGYGLSPKYYEDVIGKKVVKPVKRGTPMSWDLI